MNSQLYTVMEGRSMADNPIIWKHIPTCCINPWKITYYYVTVLLPVTKQWDKYLSNRRKQLMFSGSSPKWKEISNRTKICNRARKSTVYCSCKASLIHITETDVMATLKSLWKVIIYNQWVLKVLWLIHKVDNRESTVVWMIQCPA